MLSADGIDGAAMSPMPVAVSLEELSHVIAAIHAAIAFPERWDEAVSAVGRLVNHGQANREIDGRLEKLLALAARDDDRYMDQPCEPAVKRVIALLAPHLKVARQLQTKLDEALAGRLAVASLDRLSIAAFVVDRFGAVHYGNAAARKLLHGGCVRLAGSGLRFSQSASNTAFEGALRRATQAPPRSSVLALSSERSEVCEIAISPLDADGAWLSPCPVPLALVVLSPQRFDERSIARRVRRLYGLTEAEARVMAALTSGKTVDEIAHEHNVRPCTVRAQVRSLFDKTGVNRQSDLVRLALTGAPLVSGPGSDG
jgi:DNA-binding CsgD family transcriptional regulator